MPSTATARCLQCVTVAAQAVPAELLPSSEKVWLRVDTEEATLCRVSNISMGEGGRSSGSPDHMNS